MHPLQDGSGWIDYVKGNVVVHVCACALHPRDPCIREGMNLVIALILHSQYRDTPSEIETICYEDLKL